MNHKKLSWPSNHSPAGLRADRQASLENIMHELKDLTCILGLGMAALQRATEDERAGYLEALHGVIGEMNLQFQRFEDWRFKYRSRARRPRSFVGSRIQRRNHVTPSAERDADRMEGRTRM